MKWIERRRIARSLLNAHAKTLERLSYDAAHAFVRPDRTLVEFGEHGGVAYFGKIDGRLETDSDGSRYVQLLISVYPMDGPNFMFPVGESVVILEGESGSDGS